MMSSNRVIFGAFNPYYGLPQRTHFIARHLSKSLKLVWIDPPSVTHFLSFCSNKLNEHFDYSLLSFVRHTEPVLIRPLALPHYCSLDFAWLQVEKIVNSVINATVGEIDTLIVSHPIFCSGAIAAKASGIRVVYDILDFYSGFGFLCRTGLSRDRQLVAESDIITVPSYRLQKMIEPKTRKCLRIPNGVRTEFLSKIVARQRSICGHPTIGYVGSFGGWVDLELVLNLARKRPSWRFLLAGEIAKGSRFVREAPANCNFVGRLLHNDVPSFIDRLDVALIPFKINELTQCSFPIKLLEYFARGKPVVSSPLLEVVAVAKNLAYIANNAREWICGIENALNEESELGTSRIELANNYTWEAIGRTYQKALGLS